MPTRQFLSQFTTKFEYIQAKSSETNKNQSNLTVVYVHGLNSQPWGKKPEAVKEFCISRHLSFIRFELVGHGSDAANFENVDFNDWKQQLFEVIDNMVSGPILLVGSSIGGWLSLVAARDRRERVIGVIGLAPAPDFTDDIAKFVLSREQLQELNTTERLVYPMKDFSYIFTKRLFDSGHENLLLTGPLNIKCPVHILHGTNDKNLDPQKPFKLLNCLTTADVILKLLKGGDHRLNRDVDIAELRNSLASFL